MTKMEKQCILNALLYYAKTQGELEGHQRQVGNSDAAVRCSANKCMAVGLASVFTEILDKPAGSVKI